MRTYHEYCKNFVEERDGEIIVITSGGVGDGIYIEKCMGASGIVVGK